MRPLLKPALRRVWRDASTLQLGLDPARAVVISGLDPGSVRLVASLDGTRDLPGVLATAADLGVDADRAGSLLELLWRAGALDDGSADQRALAGLARPERERLAPDLAAASLVRAGTDGGVGVLARRRAAVVGVHGAGRVGATVATLLASAGVGSLVVDDEAHARPEDAAPAGLSADDVGARRADAALRAARRAAPSLRRPRPDSSEQPQLAVITTTAAVAPGLPDRLVGRGVPHLLAAVREGTGIVGPLVLPGRSSCLRCHDLHRADRDPGWPRVAAQLSSGAQRSVACDVVLATAVAAHAAMQALAFLDGDPAPPAVDGTFEIRQPDGLVRRRTWSAHPLCGCGWRPSDAGPRTA